MTLPAIIYLDRYGRRYALIIGSFLMMTFLFVSGALQQYYGQPNTDATRTGDNKEVTWIVLGNRPVSNGIITCSYLFVAAFAMTWGPVSWTYPAEIFPNEIRARAVSLATAANWFWNMVLAFAVPPLLTSISYNMVSSSQPRSRHSPISQVDGTGAYLRRRKQSESLLTGMLSVLHLRGVQRGSLRPHDPHGA